MLPKATKPAKEKVKQTCLDGHLQEIPRKSRQHLIQMRHSVKQQLSGLSPLIRYGCHHGHHQSQLIMNLTSLSKPLNTQNFAIWLHSHCMQPMVSPSPATKWLQEEILDMFARHMDDLKTDLKVTHNLLSIWFLHDTDMLLQSDLIHGEISLTCDVWQASNTDGYFTVTGHWIEEPHSGVWEVQSVVLSFIQLNNAHNGKQIGGALFMVMKHLEIQNHVSLLLNEWDWCTIWLQRALHSVWYILALLVYPILTALTRCLAHVINLATQAVIKSHSKSKFYDPSKPEDHIPETLAFTWDAVGLVCAICVEVNLFS